jgi:hypothetical protein
MEKIARRDLFKMVAAVGASTAVPTVAQSDVGLCSLAVDAPGVPALPIGEVIILWIGGHSDNLNHIRLGILEEGTRPEPFSQLDITPPHIACWAQRLMEMGILRVVHGQAFTLAPGYVIDRDSRYLIAGAGWTETTIGDRYFVGVRYTGGGDARDEVRRYRFCPNREDSWIPFHARHHVEEPIALPTGDWWDGYVEFETRSVRSHLRQTFVTSLTRWPQVIVVPQV